MKFFPIKARRSPGSSNLRAPRANSPTPRLSPRPPSTCGKSSKKVSRRGSHRQRSTAHPWLLTIFVPCCLLFISRNCLAARALIVEDHLRECVSCRSYAHGRAVDGKTNVGWRMEPASRGFQWSFARLSFAAAALVVLVALAWTGRNWYIAGPPGSRARIDSIAGPGVSHWPAGERPLNMGDEIGQGEFIRTAANSHADRGALRRLQSGNESARRIGRQRKSSRHHHPSRSRQHHRAGRASPHRPPLRQRSGLHRSRHRHGLFRKLRHQGLASRPSSKEKSTSSTLVWNPSCTRAIRWPQRRASALFPSARKLAGATISITNWLCLRNSQSFA